MMINPLKKCEIRNKFHILKYINEGMTYKYKNPIMTTGGSCDARYCYSVWMRHLIFYYERKQNIPQVVVEFGPGDTIGTGLIALLCGCEEYYAMDFTRYSGMKNISKIFDELYEMIRRKSDIPDDMEFPNCVPKLKTYDFPNKILTDEILDKSLNKKRIEEIKNSIRDLKRRQDASMIHYMAPWWLEDTKDIKCDLVFSQAVFEHIDDYKKAHKVIGTILKSGGIVSHVIDFDCHECADQWNGHLTYGRFIWKLIYGSRPYFLNRISLSKHIKEMRLSGVKIEKIIRTRGNNGVSRKDLCRECHNICERDFHTKNAYVNGIKIT